MKYFQLLFVQRGLYNTLLSKDFTLTDLIAVLKEEKVKDISPMTIESIRCTNSLIYSTLFNKSNLAAISNNSKFKQPITEDQEKYITTETKNYLTEHEINYDNPKCYEIVTSSDANIVYAVVVVEKGFLSLVTTNSETLQLFYRDLIRHSFGFEANNFEINREYLGLKMNQGYFDLVKLRLDR